MSWFIYNKLKFAYFLLKTKISYCRTHLSSSQSLKKIWWKLTKPELGKNSEKLKQPTIFSVLVQNLKLYTAYRSQCSFFHHWLLCPRPLHFSHNFLRPASAKTSRYVPAHKAPFPPAASLVGTDGPAPRSHALGSARPPRNQNRKRQLPAINTRAGMSIPRAAPWSSSSWSPRWRPPRPPKTWPCRSAAGWTSTSARRRAACATTGPGAGAWRSSSRRRRRSWRTSPRDGSSRRTRARGAPSPRRSSTRRPWWSTSWLLTAPCSSPRWAPRSSRPRTTAWTTRRSWSARRSWWSRRWGSAAATASSTRTWRIPAWRGRMCIGSTWRIALPMWRPSRSAKARATCRSRSWGRWRNQRCSIMGAYGWTSPDCCWRLKLSVWSTSWKVQVKMLRRFHSVYQTTKQLEALRFRSC